MSFSVSAIETRELTVAYGNRCVLRSVDFVVPQQVVMGLIGPNGAGKSTLLKSVLNLVPRIHGQVKVFGKSAASIGREVGYIPQRSSVDWDYPITVRDLVTMGSYGRLGWLRRPGARERHDATTAMERMGILDLQSRQIGELSGGQQQRAFLARAFVQDAPIYFLDEPFTGVDVTTEKAMVEILHQMRDSGKTIVVVQHDLSTVGDYLDEVTLLNKRVVASGPVDTAFTPANIEATYIPQSALQLA